MNGEVPEKSVDERYSALVVSLRQQLEGGFKQAQQLLNLARIQTYWNIGRSIVESFLDEDYRAAYGVSLYQTLGEELEYKERVLQHMVQFYRTYPECPHNTPLTWTHYRYLIGVSDQGQRLKLEQQMIKKGVSIREAKKMIPRRNAELASQPQVTGGRLQCARGVPYLYAIRQGADLNGVPYPARLDLGFHLAVDSAAADYIRFVNSRLVVSMKENGGYRLETYHGLTEELYTYAACVDRVIDGDTLIARIDLGYGLLTTQRLRLRGIDAPEVATVAGVKAREYLTGRLKGLDRIVVKTHKDPEKYGRYLTDLFILPGIQDVARIAREGVYINQELLDRGLASIY